MFSNIVRSFSSLLLLTASVIAADARPGDLDSTFDYDGKVVTPVGDYQGSSEVGLFLQSDGKIVVMRGDEEHGTGFLVVRYNSDGSLDTGFGNSGTVLTDPGGPVGDEYAIARSAVEQPGGKLLVAGISGQGFTLIRYNDDGTLDTTYSGDGIAAVATWGPGSFERAFIVEQPDGKILGAGGTQIGRFLTDGSLDPTFGTGGLRSISGCEVLSMVRQPSDGYLLVAGYGSGAGASVLQRFDTSGNLDPAFGVGGKVAGTGRRVGLSLEPDGQILVSHYPPVAPINSVAVTRYNPDGALDTTFDVDGTVQVPLPGAPGWALELGTTHVQADGKILVTGYRYHNDIVLGYVSEFVLVRLRPDGAVDTTFGTNGIVVTPNLAGTGATALVEQQDAKLVVAGTGENPNGVYNFGLARYLNQVCGNAIVEVPELCDDGNVVPGDGCEAGCKLTPEVQGGVLLPNEPISTDVESDGATLTDPIETTIVTPSGGAVSINETGDAPGGTSGYQMVGTVVQISAPLATAAEPLDFRFTIDASLVPAGTTALTLAVFRNGVLVPDCAAGSGGGASPDPCVAERLALPDGDIQVRVFTSAASAWTLGTPAACGDGIVGDAEQCDDGGTSPNDGCDSGCQVENGWDCQSICTPICGDGLVRGSEQCDDRNQISGDCCSSACQVETPGSACPDDGSACTTDTCSAAGTCLHTAGNAGTTCRPAAGDCDQAETCSGTATTCPTDAKVAGGTACADDGNTCTDDVCDGSANACTHPANSLPCDDGLFCNGADNCAASACTQHAGDPCNGGAVCDDLCNEDGDDCAQPAGTGCTADGNPCTNDVCDGAGACGVANAAGCDDGLFCTVSDTCSGGACVGMPRNCDDGDLCTADSCDEAADACLHEATMIDPASCYLAERAKLQIADSSDDDKDKLSWQWSVGEAFAQDVLGDPLTATRYALCVYDSSASVPTLAASVDVPASGVFWQSQAPKGLDYKDKDGGSDGVTKLQVRTGDAGKTKVKLVARGTALPLPAPVGSAFFQQDPLVAAQLVNDLGYCWTSEFPAASTLSNEAGRFKAQVK